MRHFFILFILSLFLTGCNDEKEQIACLESDKLRVQIGETIFAFPRKDIGDMAGRDVQWEGEPIYSDKVDADDICQKNNDKPMVLEQMGLHIAPLSCFKGKGNCSKLKGGLRSIKKTNNESPQEIVRKKNIQKCIDDPYFNTCTHSMPYKNVRFYFQYNVLSYPTKEIEVTEQIARDYLRKYDITSKESK